MLANKLFAAKHHSRRSFAGGTALQHGERIEHRTRGKDLFQGVLVLELGVRVPSGMLMILDCDQSNLLLGGSIFFHMLSSSVSEHLWGRRGGLGRATRIHHGQHMLVHWIGPIHPLAAKGTSLHLLESKDQDAIRTIPRDELLGQVKRGGTSGAVVVHIVHWNASQSNFVESS